MWLKPWGIRADGEKQWLCRAQSSGGMCVCVQRKGPSLTKALHFCPVTPFTDEQTEPQTGPYLAGGHMTSKPLVSTLILPRTCNTFPDKDL